MITSEHPIFVTPLVESTFGLDGGAMFGIVPRPLWERTNPPDAANRIQLAARCLLVRWADGRAGLVDVGLGGSWSEKERGIYAITGQDIGLRSALAAHGLTPQDIHHVFLTHLHFDHAGGVSHVAEDGQRRLSFPNATHWVQRRNWSWAHSPSARDGGSYRVDDFACLEQGDLRLIDGISELMPGVEVLPQHGHTFGMQCVKIATEEATWVHMADLIPTTSHLRDAYVMGYDLQPLVTVEEKRALLYHAAREGWRLVYEHDPLTAWSHVEIDAKGQPRAVRHT
jgi:glyoxylase-like metal-dependent hydrolase (beta-lactamase superfamily II)